MRHCARTLRLHQSTLLSQSAVLLSLCLSSFASLSLSLSLAGSRSWYQWTRGALDGAIRAQCLIVTGEALAFGAVGSVDAIGGAGQARCNNNTRVGGRLSFALVAAPCTLHAQRGRATTCASANMHTALPLTSGAGRRSKSPFQTAAAERGTAGARRAGATGLREQANTARTPVPCCAGNQPHATDSSVCLVVCGCM